MYKTIFFFTAVLFFVSCSDNRPKREVVVGPTQVTAAVDNLIKNTHTAPTNDSIGNTDGDNSILDNYVVASAPDKDITSISKTCALIIHPTDKQLEKYKNEMRGEDFSTVADDYAFYQSQYLEVANKRKIETPDIKTRYIKFVGKSKTLLIDRCAKVSNGWMVILFRPDSLPRITENLEAETAFTQYFGK